MKQILLNGMPYTICQNLFEYLQYANYDGWLWIYQLSVDQKITPERNHQVSMMNQIYSAATKVIIWLGSKGELSLAFKLLNCVYNPDADMKGVFVKKYQSEKLRSQLNPSVRLTNKLTKSVLASIGELLHSRYWTRLWIIQEIFLAKKLKIQ
jgi:hypothetical protein